MSHAGGARAESKQESRCCDWFAGVNASVQTTTGSAGRSKLAFHTLMCH